jgi:putative ABC transport system substrate-binding protein
MLDSKRREFIALLGGGGLLLAAKVRRARGQQPAGRLRHIGLLHPGTPPNLNVEAFRQGLRDLGYVDGQNIVIEYRWVPSRLVLEFGDAISGISRVPSQAARSIG